MFIQPVKRSSTFKKFSKHENILISEDGRFALQKRKKQTEHSAEKHDDDEPSVTASPTVARDESADFDIRHQKHWNYRILLLGNPYYELAFADDLVSLKNKEWKYITSDLPKRVPENKGEKELVPWFIAHFTCLAMELSKDKTNAGPDSHPESCTTPTVPSLNVMNQQYTSVPSAAPSQPPQILPQHTNVIHPIRSHNSSNVLIPTTTYPLYGFLPFVIVALLVNIPVMLIRDMSDSIFLVLIAVINLLIFVKVLCGFPSISGISTLLPYNKVYKISPPSTKTNTTAVVSSDTSAPAADADSSDEQVDDGKKSLDALQPGGATTVGPQGFTPALSLKVSKQDEVQPNTYSDPMGESWTLRTGPDYNVHKKKAPSSSALFDLLGMDVFQSKKKIQHIARYVDFEPLYTLSKAPYINLGTEIDYHTQDVIKQQQTQPLQHVIDARNATEQEIATQSWSPSAYTLENIPKYDYKPDPTGKVQPKGELLDGFHFGTMDRPLIWIINMQIPTYQPSYMGGETDGEGMNLIWYLRATPETQRDLLRPNSICPAVRVLKKYVLANPADPDFQKNMDRFKNIPRLVNTNEFNFGYMVNKLITQYNAKPFLTRPQGVLHRGPGYVNFDLDIHNFCYTAKKVLYGFLDKMDKVILDWCFCIEGYDNDELPEVSLAQIRLVKISYQSFPSWEKTYELIEMNKKKQQ